VRKLVYLDAALDDLDHILRSLTTSSMSLDVGLRFTVLLRQQCIKLASLPGTLGRVRPELRPDIRSFPFKGYIIFFRYQTYTFEVVNLLEGHRDILAHFAEE
jgi:plasmid stabilization system protein ParE